jgi:putative membrane protein
MGRPDMRRIPWVCAGIAVLAQICWVLASGQARLALTIVSVVAFTLASVSHAWLTRGAVWAGGYLVISVGIGWSVEAVGRSTGIPFGTYDYTDALGWKVGGVPLVIPLAWAMMAYPCLLLGRTLTDSRVFTPILAAWTLAAWDLFLDPQMVGEGYWTFTFPTPALPGSPGIPLTNYAGWLGVAVLMMVVLDRLPREPRSDWRSTSGRRVVVPTALLTWTYFSSVLANLAFFGRPWVALWGAVGMGVTVLPWLYRLSRDRAPAPAASGVSPAA